MEAMKLLDVMRYMAWIRKNQAEPGQQVRGVIVAREISEDSVVGLLVTRWRPAF